MISPFDDETQEETDATLADNYGDMYWKVLSKDVYKMSTVKGVIFLPGWEKSRGARLEAYIGLLNGFPMWSYYENPSVALEELSHPFVAGVCAAQWVPDSVLRQVGLIA